MTSTFIFTRNSIAARWRTRDPAWGFALAAFAISRAWFLLWSLLISLVVPVVAQNLDLFGAPVLATFDLTSSARAVYSRELDGAILSFRAGERGTVVDVQSGSVWSLREGRALSGAYVGRALNASPYSVEDVFPYRGVAAESPPLLGLWQRFDTNWYLAIAERGYGTNEGDVHFPPLYPALIRVVVALVGDSMLAALLISNFAFIAALALFYQSTREWFGAPVAARAATYLVLFPTAFFFLAAYTEPLFLLATLLALRAMQTRAWLSAGLWCFCAVLLRLQGVALLVPLAYELWSARPLDKRFARVVSLTLPALGLALYLFIRALVGDSAVIPTTEPNLFARLAPPWENYWYGLQTLASGKFLFADVLNFVLTTIVLVAFARSWRKLPRALALYTVASLVILTLRVVESQPLNSMSRYTLTLFPIFMLFGIWGAKGWAQRALVYPSVALALYLSAQFFLWGWVA